MLSSAANSIAFLLLVLGVCVLPSKGNLNDPLEYEEIEKKQETKFRPEDRFGKTIRRNAPGKVHGNFVRIGRGPAQLGTEQILGMKDEDRQVDGLSSDTDRCASLLSQDGDEQVHAGSPRDISVMTRCIRSLMTELESCRGSDAGVKRSGTGVSSNVKFVRIG
jgi:hypothetical protein